MRISARHLPMALLLFVAAAGATPQAVAPVALQAASTPSTPSSDAFSAEQLDQMMAPLALYPDSLLAQVLMASTYPGDVADAVKWSKAHPDAKGDDAVRQVGSQSWDPSVQSLVAFPQVLDTLGKDPAWVQRMGDAFLAQPDEVMDSVQRLRRQAQAAGNLKSTEQLKVSTEPAAATTTTTTTTAPASSTIIIEPADPQVVYVPAYNSTTVYGTWPYPSYPPYYYPPSPYYYPGSALWAGLAFGTGVAITASLWGNFNWGHGDIDIDVNRYNNINSNRQINRGDNTWRHNSANRDGVPYRDRNSREQFGRQKDGAAQRDNFRGHDPARSADRERARQSMSQRGFDTPAASNREARDRAGQASRQMDRQQAGTRDAASRQGAQNRATQGSTQRNAQARQGTRQQYQGNRGGQNNAFSGASNPGQARASSNRGHGSYSASQRPSSARGGGRQMSRPARSGGGARRR
ncbi:DUF3300 domain-containing protein [Lysobacter sp. GCM10012299]|uniref:DUF3300 domain-containing protein n=1 Tax=Lysobacter sp. GCM10012299 TaxID=3317333 RepID=UPI003613C1C8